MSNAMEGQLNSGKLSMPLSKSNHYHHHHRILTSFADRTSSTYQRPPVEHPATTDSDNARNDASSSSASDAGDGVKANSTVIAAAQQASQKMLLNFSSLVWKPAEQPKSNTTNRGQSSFFPQEPQQPDSWSWWISVAFVVCSILVCAGTGIQLLCRQRQRRRHYQSIPATTSLVV